MNENKLGMFIHWGLYSMLGLHEQAMARYGLDKGEYEALAGRFDPVEYDPDAWVAEAKAAGMKYICFTAKHHDGFCMWDTAFTDYKITNTPYGKDVLKMLADACERQGMLLSIYYSNPDWHHPAGYNPHSTHQWCAVNTDSPDLERYREYVREQVRELLTGYGRIYSFFWDIPPKVEDPSMNELVRSLQPGILINDRGWGEGDFSTPEREAPGSLGGRYSRLTEACDSVGLHSWGYREDEDFHSLRYLTSSIDRVMSRGGSFLLNVGPDPLGRISGKYLHTLHGVGDWYRRMGGCLESHRDDEFDYGVKGAPCKVTEKDGRSYFHFPDGLPASAVALTRYPSLPKRVRLMNTSEELPWRVEPLPGYFGKDGRAGEFLHLCGIPVDALASEAIVVEVEWRQPSPN